MSGLQNEYGIRGFQVLGAAFNPDAAALVPGFIRQFKPVFPVGICSREAAAEYQQRSIIQPGYVPQLVFVDRKGVIQAQYAGEDSFFKEPEKNMRQLIEKLLKEPAGPVKKRASKRPAAVKHF